MLLVSIDNMFSMNEVGYIFIELIEGIDKLKDLVDGGLWVGDGINLGDFVFELRGENRKDIEIPVGSGEFGEGKCPLVESTSFVDILAK